MCWLLQQRSRMRTGELCEPQRKQQETLCHSPFLSSRKWKIFLRSQSEGAHILPKVQEEHYFLFTSRNLIFSSAETVLARYYRTLYT